jgi:hypothetical protein
MYQGKHVVSLSGDYSFYQEGSQIVVDRRGVRHTVSEQTQILLLFLAAYDAQQKLASGPRPRYDVPAPSPNSMGLHLVAELCMAAYFKGKQDGKAEPCG